jgi:hypothetical protein
MSGIVWSDGETIVNGTINTRKIRLNTSVVFLLPTDEKFNYDFCTVHCDKVKQQNAHLLN